MRLWVYSCPASQRSAARAVLDGLALEGSAEGELNLNEPYYDSEVLHEGAGTALDLAVALANAAPGVSFLLKVTSCAAPGIIRAYTPHLGHYGGELNSNGLADIRLCAGVAGRSRGYVASARAVSFKIPVLGTGEGTQPMTAQEGTRLHQTWRHGHRSHIRRHKLPGRQNHQGIP